MYVRVRPRVCARLLVRAHACTRDDPHVYACVAHVYACVAHCGAHVGAHASALAGAGSRTCGCTCVRERVYMSSSLGSRCVPWLGEGLSMSAPNDPVLCCPLPYRVAPIFVQVVSPPIGWAPLTSFLVIWSPSGDARGPSVVFEAVDMPCPGHV